MTFEDVLSRFEHRKAIAGGFLVRCPAHADDTASLAISQGDQGRTLLHCHAGCAAEAIVGAMGLTVADLFSEPPQAHHGSTWTTYDYRDEQGGLLYQACRIPEPGGGKTFRQRRPDGAGGWIYKLEDVRRVPYRLNELPDRLAVFVAEGEKDVDRLWSLGLPATTNAGGAGKWKTEYSALLKAAGVARVCVLPDNDAPGEAHGRFVARCCHDVGLSVKLVLLPDLPDKGDVSDWLDAGHSRDQFLTLVREAPYYRDTALVSVAPKLHLTSLSDLLSEPDDAVEWVVDDRVPGGGLVLLAGKPKAGKSVLARNLAYAVAAGETWLGHHVTVGSVWYLAFEDKRTEVRKHFKRLGATGQEPLWFLVGDTATGVMDLLTDRAKTEKPALIIVDTLQRLIQCKDMSDYAEVTTKFKPLLNLARDTGAAIVCVHHANKWGKGLDSILGSTALSGCVDNVFILGRGDQHRTLSSIQRVGPDLEGSVVEMDEDTGRVTLAGSAIEVETDDCAQLMVEALRGEVDPQQERWLREQVDARHETQARALRMMLRRGWVFRVGQGRRGAPYLYGITETARNRVSQNDTTYRIGGSRNFDESAKTGNQNMSFVDNELTPKTVSGSGGSYIYIGEKVPSQYAPQDHLKIDLLAPVVPAGNKDNGNRHHEINVNDCNGKTYSGSHEPFSLNSDDCVDDSLAANPDDGEMNETDHVCPAGESATRRH